MGVTGLSSTEEPMEGGEGEHTLGSCGALFKLGDKVVATNVCGGLFEEESDIGRTRLPPPLLLVDLAMVLTTVEPT